jgi:excisionase family DNA binding protein
MTASTTPFLSIEEVADRLRTDVGWVREKIRRRSPNPMPVFNVGRHLLFEWEQVAQWVRNSPRPIHAAHKRRWRKKPKLARAA